MPLSEKNKSHLKIHDYEIFAIEIIPVGES
jgi:hypothetical protein